MRTIHAVAIAATIGFASLAPSAAQADFTYNLSVSGGFTGSGSISFDIPSGTDVVFSDITGVSAFSFHTSAGHGSPQDYGLTDLFNVTWSIDSSSHALTLFLTTNVIPVPSFGLSMLVLDNDPIRITDMVIFGCGRASATESLSIFCGDELSTAQGALSAVQVPEPSTRALFAAGLAGLGLMRRRRKAL